MRPASRPLPTLVLGCLLSLNLAPCAAWADGWTVRLKGVATDYDDHRFNSGLGGFDEIRLDGGSGFGASVEYRQNRWLGWELAASRITLDGDYRVVDIVATPDPPGFGERVRFEDHGDFDVEPVTLGLRVYLLHDRPVTLFVGPEVARIRYHFDVSEAQSRDEEPGFGGMVGVELHPRGSRWSVGLEVRQLEALHDSKEHDLYGGLSLPSAALTVGYRIGAPAAD